MGSLGTDGALGCYGLGFFLGRFQYGLLHFGQIVGVTVKSRGIHIWPHRSQRQPSILIRATGRDCRMSGYP